MKALILPTLVFAFTLMGTPAAHAGSPESLDQYGQNLAGPGTDAAVTGLASTIFAGYALTADEELARTRAASEEANLELNKARASRRLNEGLDEYQLLEPEAYEARSNELLQRVREEEGALRASRIKAMEFDRQVRAAMASGGAWNLPQIFPHVLRPEQEALNLLIPKSNALPEDGPSGLLRQLRSGNLDVLASKMKLKPEDMPILEAARDAFDALNKRGANLPQDLFGITAAEKKLADARYAVLQFGLDHKPISPAERGLWKTKANAREIEARNAVNQTKADLEAAEADYAKSGKKFLKGASGVAATVGFITTGIEINKFLNAYLQAPRPGSSAALGERANTKPKAGFSRAEGQPSTGGEARPSGPAK